MPSPIRQPLARPLIEASGMSLLSKALFLVAKIHKKKYSYHFMALQALQN